MTYDLNTADRKSWEIDLWPHNINRNKYRTELKVSTARSIIPFQKHSFYFFCKKIRAVTFCLLCIISKGLYCIIGFEEVRNKRQSA